MRILFPELSYVKAAAKRLSSVTGVRLSACQEAIAKASGYRDWHELQATSASSPAFVPPLKLQDLCEFICNVANRVNGSAGDVQYALVSSPLAPDSALSLQDHLELRASVYRRMEIPDPVGRQPGAVGRQKRTGRHLILRSYGSSTQYISNRSANTGIASSEFVMPRVPIPLFIPRRLYVPYGAWTERDGAKVLFSRNYLPLWRLREGSAPERVSPMLWISYVEQEWFWTDETTPWDDDERWNRQMEKLTGLGVRGLPKLVEVLPLLVHDSSRSTLMFAAEQMFGRRENQIAA